MQTISRQLKFSMTDYSNIVHSLYFFIRFYEKSYKILPGKSMNIVQKIFMNICLSPQNARLVKTGSLFTYAVFPRILLVLLCTPHLLNKHVLNKLILLLSR